MYVTKSKLNLSPVIALFMMVAIEPVLLNAQQTKSEYVSSGVIADSLGSIQERYDMMGGILSLACKDEPAQFFPVGLADFEVHKLKWV